MALPKLKKKSGNGDGEQQTMPEVLTLEQVAEYLQLPVNVVVSHVRRGEIPATKIGREWRVRKTRLDRWLDEQATSTDQPSLEWLIEETRVAAEEAGIRTPEDVDRIVAEVHANRQARVER